MRKALTYKPVPYDMQSVDRLLPTLFDDEMEAAFRELTARLYYPITKDAYYSRLRLLRHFSVTAWRLTYNSVWDKRVTGIDTLLSLRPQHPDVLRNHLHTY